MVEGGKVQEAQAPLLNPEYGSRDEIAAARSHDLTLLDLVDRILDKGMVINGDITIAIAGADLLSLKINLVIASLETAKRYGIELPWEKWNPQEAESKQNSRSLRGHNGKSNGKKNSRKAMLAEAR